LNNTGQHYHPKKILPDCPKTRINSAKTNFSDVIAIKGNQGHLQTVSAKKPSGICVKKSDYQKPVKLQAQIAYFGSILEKEPL